MFGGQLVITYIDAAGLSLLKKKKKKQVQTNFL